QPTFQAINLEPEESIDDEIDTTRQIHIDEALKRFQTALKLHAQGPRFFDEAADAYDDLFKSEIFRYPEAATDYERAEQQPGQLAPDGFVAEVDVQPGEVDGADSTLPQALFLAHKNHGQFVLDRIKHKARSLSTPSEHFFQTDQVRQQAEAALYDFNAALDRDPSDAELWRRTARVAGFLKSARIRRYCFEAAIELDDDPAVDDVEPPSLAEGLAGEELKQQLQVLDDHMALSHPIMRPWLRREMPVFIRKNLDPIPFLPNPTKDLISMRNTIEGVSIPRLALPCSRSTWSQLGMALLQFLTDVGCSGRAVVIELPETDAGEDAAETTDTVQPQLDEGANEQLTTETTSAMPMDVDDGGKDQEASGGEARKSGGPTRKGRSNSNPTLKRSQSLAGIGDTAEEEIAGEKRSKRIRRRETAGGEVVDRSTLLANQLAEYQAADSNLFHMTRDILENLGVTESSTLDSIACVLESCVSEDRPGKMQDQATKDLKSTITNFNAENAKMFVNKKEAGTLGMSAFLEHAKGGSQSTLNFSPFKDSHGTASFVRRMNSDWMTVQDVAWEWVKAIAPSYLASKWSEDMKTTVVQVASRFDQSIHEGARYEIAQALASRRSDDETDALHEVVEMLFELHLDIYERITNPNSAVDFVVRVEAKGRLGRWLDLASQMVRRPRTTKREVSVRFLWAAVFSTTLTGNASRDYILQCWTSLRDYLASQNLGPLYLPNNAVLPEISAAAADREISKLTTMDFFLGLFQDDISDPVAIIDNLEPVLNPDSVFVSNASNMGLHTEEDGQQQQSRQDKIPIKDCASQSLRDLWKFFSCQLRAIETITADLQGKQYLKTSSETRPALLLRMLKSLDELLIHALSLALNESTSFDIIDDDHLKSTASGLARLNCMLHVAAMVEDEIRIGMTQSPSNSPLLQSFLTKLRELQSHLAEFLAAVHQVLGLRKSCKVSNKIFLKMMRVEMLRFRNIENWEDYLGQVLYDLHGLKLGVGIWEVQDHGCPPEKLERRNTIQLADKITVLARRMPMRDLLKSDLKATIEHMQGAIGPVRSTPQMVHNLRNYTEYFKKPIHPLRLYQALRGEVELDTVSVNAPEMALAKHGWFYLLGTIALSKYKLVDLSKRQTPGAMDELRIGATFLRHQLQFTPGNWEVWFRLAECFDYEVEDAVVWTADKMNKDRAELVKFQRNSIHCHTLALSKSVGAGQTYSEDGDPLHDLYHSFAMRLYASSREPFAMEPFQHSDHERFFIQPEDLGTFQRVAHSQMEDFKVWRYACRLFRKAMKRKPQDWSPGDRAAKPTVKQLIGALEHTIDIVTAMPKSRHSEPILEPHYKILSIVHKLVLRKDLNPQEGAEILSRQPYGLAWDAEANDAGDWEEYLIKSLRHLRDKDKSNWQHRMIVRHARLLFDEEAQESGDYMQAKAAFGVLRESMFTKTMVMNVWKCDAERPGRHHVFTEQYVRFMVKILVVMNDRVSLEALLRRIRKKGADFYHFTDLWQTCCHAYLRLLRQTHKVEPNEEDRFKSVAPEEYEIMTDRIGNWASEQGNDLPVLQCMKEAIELKKLNGGLMKAGAIDDLISDAYTAIYFNIAPTLPGPDPAEVIEMRAKERAKEEAQVDGTNGAKPPNAPNNNGSAPHSGQEPVNGGEAMDKQAEVAPRRKTGIRRADVLRKAEQAYLRSMERPKSVGPGAVNGKTRVGSTASGKRGSQSAHGGDDDDAGSDAHDHDGTGHHGRGDAQDQDVTMKDEEGEGAPAETTAASSARGSAHDSADDESDLSDVPEGWDEEPPPSLMFPNLRRSTGPTAAAPDSSEKSEDEEAEGRDGGEEEHEEGEEGHGEENEQEADGGEREEDDEREGGEDEDGDGEEGGEREEAHYEGGDEAAEDESLEETAENLEEGVDDGVDEIMEDAEDHHAEDEAGEEAEEEVGGETGYEAEEEVEDAEEAEEDAEEEAEGDADDEEDGEDDEAEEDAEEEAEEDSREIEETGSENDQGDSEQDEARRRL
ncbi:hypothetical protein ACRALDRAFT_1033783, partial [Sodiomyces alcalophilus JCM 7366]|uniref:uncharacterized protein n=1 Tax=Sodiomyces alcalophilus JCM 7366 TaxID=591952 RepID=UPI0039B39926